VKEFSGTQAVPELVGQARLPQNIGDTE